MVWVENSPEMCPFLNELHPLVDPTGAGLSQPGATPPTLIEKLGHIENDPLIDVVVHPQVADEPPGFVVPPGGHRG